MFTPKFGHVIRSTIQWLVSFYFLYIYLFVLVRFWNRWFDVSGKFISFSFSIFRIINYTNLVFWFYKSLLQNINLVLCCSTHLKLWYLHRWIVNLRFWRLWLFPINMTIKYTIISNREIQIQWGKYKNTSQ